MPLNKQQKYALIAARLIGGKNYLMTQECYDGIKDDKIVGPLLINATPRAGAFDLKPVAAAVQHALSKYKP